MFVPELVALLCCPTDRAPLALREGGLECAQCGTIYPIQDGYVELLPRGKYEHTTRYTEEQGGAILDYQDISRPLLSAQVKNNLLNEFLDFQREDVVLDLGCGNGKFAYWNKDRVRTMLALDLAPWFADRARAELLLLRGDLRAVPVQDRAMDKVFAIDVLEHLTRADLECVLQETCRVLKPGGHFFVFSNTRERQTLAPIMAPQQAVTRWLTRRGAIDFTRDDWRKSDHVKALRTYPELVEVFQSNGLVVKRVAFWNGVFQGWIENVFVKLGESYLSRKTRGGNKLERQVTARANVRTAMRTPNGAKYTVALEAMSRVMQLDLLFFRGLRAGPYFLLAERK
jgi:ubiquinone/menaquinone biosynthesis C-methylase UbiE/uncharacterized protein YbaR (Trm112 family)